MVTDRDILTPAVAGLVISAMIGILAISIRFEAPIVYPIIIGVMLVIISLMTIVALTNDVK